MNTPIRPKTLAHIVYRTYRYQEMINWYVAVFNATIQHQTPVLAFLTYDEEHHRIALVDLGLIKGPSDEKVPRGLPGVDHVAFGYASLRELLDKYEELKAKQVLPYWCIHHGTTISLYYADPDGNQMEFQAEAYRTSDEANEFMHGPGFAENPIGVEFEPDAMRARLLAGESEESLLLRKVHQPVSPVRGSMMG